MTKSELIDYLVTRRQQLGGSISERNHRRLLEGRTKAELQAQYDLIQSHAGVPPPALDLIADRDWPRP